MKLQQIHEARYHEFSSYDPNDKLEFEEIISPRSYVKLGWKRPHKPLKVFKATNNSNKTAIPGFTTTNIDEAKAYLGNGEWGGQYLVEIDLMPPRRNQTQKDMVLDGREGPIKIEAGCPTILVRGSEVIILQPETQRIHQPDHK